LRAVALIPAYNESRTIEQVIAGIRQQVDHVLVVDDGSTDATAQLALTAGAEVIRRTANGGKGLAVRAGLARVLEDSFTHVLMLDADLQHKPEEAALLLATAVRTDADLVIGERQFRRESMPPNRYWANRIGSRALSAFVGVPINDTQCGFRVCRIDALRSMHLRSRGYEIETEMLIKLRRRGASVVSVPITAVYAGGRSKLRPVRDTTKTCFLAVYYRYLERL